MLLSWLADEIIKIYYLWKDIFDFVRVCRSVQSPEPSRDKRGEGIGIGDFFHQPPMYLIAVQWYNNWSFTLSLLCFNDCCMRCIQSEINSFIFWNSKSTLYLKSVMPIYIWDGAESVRQCYTSLTGPVVLHASYLVS